MCTQVHQPSLQGSARRLVKAALQEAARKREMRYSDLKKIDRGVRRHFHDDITVIVVYLDWNMMSTVSSIRSAKLSIRGGGINLPPNTLAPCTTSSEASDNWRSCSWDFCICHYAVFDLFLLYTNYQGSFFGRWRGDDLKTLSSELGHGLKIWSLEIKELRNYSFINCVW